MVRSKKAICVLISGLILSLVFIFSTAVAQDKSPESTGSIFIQKIKADKKLLVAENMQLTESEAKAFWPVYKKYQDELFLLRARTAKLIKDYADNYDNLTNAKAKKLLDEMVNIESLRVKLNKTYLPMFRKALPETKVVRYYQIENKINAVLYNEFAENIPLAKIDNK
jgi:hypothetical protein